MPRPWKWGIFDAYMFSTAASMAEKGATVQRMVASLGDDITKNCLGMTVRWFKLLSDNADDHPLERLNDILNAMPSICATQFMEMQTFAHIEHIKDTPRKDCLPTFTEYFTQRINGASRGSGLQFTHIETFPDPLSSGKKPLFLKKLSSVRGLLLLKIQQVVGPDHVLGIYITNEGELNRVFEANTGEFEVPDECFNIFFDQYQDFRKQNEKSDILSFNLFAVGKDTTGLRRPKSS